MIQSRSIPLCIILSIITCGIYGLYWLVCLANDANTASGRTQEPSGGMVLLLTIVTCNIYGLFWMYKAGEKIDSARVARGMPSQNNGLIYLLLSLFGLSIVSYALMQNEFNQFAGSN